MEQHLFPFSAIVGQEQLKLALLMAVVEPSLGGVLISGHKGTGKSTAVRSLHALLPPLEDGRPTPLVELPLNATEDRVAGTIDVERALREGERRFEPGLLAAADRGLLYVDEVNLLDDHLVDLLLDAAASGINRVEREGISYSHPARFVLIGTMNPEEGSLRPQFLDRFGLFASVSGLEGLDQRAEIARRRLAFDADPAGFSAEWADAERALTQRIAQAKAGLAAVALSDERLMLAVRLAAAAKTRGHRAEIAIVKGARALAALLGRSEANDGDVADAARLVLPHRMEAGPLDSPEKLEARLAELVAATLAGRDPDEPEAEDAAELDEEEMSASMQVPGSFAAGSILFSAPEKKSPQIGSSPPTRSPASANRS